MNTLITTSDQQTLAFGKFMADHLKPGSVVALYGDLGAGKTVFTRGVASGLEIDEAVTSPTFTVVQEYSLDEDTWFFHLDMYRIDNEESALAFGIEEYLFVNDGITLVEWPERIAGLMHELHSPEEEKHLFKVTITHEGDGIRKLELPVEWSEYVEKFTKEQEA